MAWHIAKKDSLRDTIFGQVVSGKYKPESMVKYGTVR
jgi:hypothetical protein